MSKQNDAIWISPIDFQKICIEVVCKFNNNEKFNLNFLIEESLKTEMKGKIDTAKIVEEIQGFLNEEADKLIYGGEKSIQACHKIIEIGLGLISVFDVDKYWDGNQGDMVYRLTLGSEDKWKERVDRLSTATKKLDWKKINCGLRNGEYTVKGRFYHTKSGAGALISRSKRKRLLDKEVPVFLGRKRSDGGISNGSLYWTLLHNENEGTEEIDFPQIWALISHNERPIGFLQLVLKNVPNEYLVLPEKDEYGIHIYEPQIVKGINIIEYINIFCSDFMAPIISFMHAVDRHNNFIEERKKYFPDDFLKAVGLTHKEGLVYENSLWKDAINEIKEALWSGYSRPTDLAVGVISNFWEDVPGISDLNLLERAEAEDTLFWLNNYREHFVHSLKVFLVGQRIIDELDCEELSCDYFEHAWMLASSVHDWSYPIERFSDIMATYWRKFFLGERFAKEYFKKDDKGNDNDKLGLIKGHANHLFTDCALGHNYMSLFFHALNQYEKVPLPGEYPDRYKYLGNESKPYNGKIIQRLTTKSDHGVASALWYLGHVLPCFNENCGLYKENLKDCDECVACKKDEINKHFEIAHAIYNHNLAVKKGTNIKIDFKDHPLAFLLIISDVLQDEGRPASKTANDADKRPLGYITRVEKEDEGSRLAIDVTYKWDISNCNGENEKIVLGSKGCLEKCREKLHGKGCQAKDEDGKPLSKNGVPLIRCESIHSCAYVTESVDFLSRLTKFMTGYPVIIKATWQSDAWGKWVNTGLDKKEIELSSEHLTAMKQGFLRFEIKDKDD